MSESRNSIITDAETLRTLCSRLANAPWIALDTEFMRVQTYRARLCLVQLATPDTVVCVDPLALSDLAPLLDLLYTPTVIKVLHAARQDLEVLLDLQRANGHGNAQRDVPPTPIFDTQIAAALVGFDDQIGYGALVEAITGHKLEKLEARTDWAARPLTTAQLHYAEDDVHYLRDVYESLRVRVREMGRESWLAEECLALTDAKLYRNDPDEAWRRLGAGAMLAPGAQTILVALASWREREAQQRDLPRGWVVPDPVLIEIARRAPNSLAALSEIPEMKPGMVRRDGEALLKIVTSASQAPAKRWWDPPERLDPEQMTLVKRLSTLAQQRARDANLSPTLLAPRREIMRLVRGDAGSTLLRGWRRTFIGDELAALCRA